MKFEEYMANQLRNAREEGSELIIMTRKDYPIIEYYKPYGYNYKQTGLYTFLGFHIRRKDLPLFKIEQLHSMLSVLNHTYHITRLENKEHWSAKFQPSASINQRLFDYYDKGSIDLKVAACGK